MKRIIAICLVWPVLAQPWPGVVQTLTGNSSSFINKYGHSWADFDGDGDMDLFLNGNASLWMNRATDPDHFDFLNVTSTYIPSVPGGGWAACFGDFDNDGRPDIYGGNSGEDFLLQNNYPGPFKSVGNQLGLNDRDWNQSINWVDHNGDGWLDIYVTHEVPGLVNDGPHEFYQNDLPNSGKFIPRFPHDTSNPDTHIYDPVNNPDTFGLADMNSHAYGLAWGDIDIDGDIDVVTGACGNFSLPPDWDPTWIYQPHDKIYENLLTPFDDGFADRTADIALIPPMEQTTGSDDWCTILFDYDNDGFMDLFIGANNGPHRLWHNTGVAQGDFNYALVDPAVHHLGPGSWGNGGSAGDFDNDGDVDIYITSNGLYRNDGEGAFTLTNFVPTSNSISDASFIDYDRDGFLDLFNFNDLFHNPGNANHWIGIELTGNVDKGTTRSAHHVKIRILSGGKFQYREHRQFVGSYSQHMVPTHFGLGLETQIEEIQVTWTHGEQTIITNVPADQYIQIDQPCDTPAVIQTLYHFCLGDTVELEGSMEGSSLEWKVESGPSLQQSQFSSPFSEMTFFTPQAPGSYQVSFGGVFCRTSPVMVTISDSDFSQNGDYDLADLLLALPFWNSQQSLGRHDLDFSGSNNVLDLIGSCFFQ